MKRIIAGSAFLLLSVGLFFSCEKVAENKKSPYLTDMNSFEEYRAKYQEKGQKYTFSYDYTVTTKRGIKLSFDRESFTDLTGKSVLGPVEVNLLECISKGDMILYNRPTVSYGNILESQGFFRITATQKGYPLLYKGQIDIEVPASIAVAGMGMFLDDKFSPVPNWTSISDSADWEENTAFFNTFLPGDSLGWINCDRFYNNPDTTYIEIVPVQNPEPLKTKVFVVFEAINSVMSVYPDQSGRFILKNVPKGMSIKAVTITNKNTEFYYGMQRADISPQLSVHPVMAQITEADLKKSLSSL